MIRGGGECMSKKKTNEEYIREVSIKNPNVEVIGEYINAKTHILHRCKIHNVEWLATPGLILQGCGCGQCKIDKDIINAQSKRKTHQQYLIEIINNNIPIEPLEEYVDGKTNIRHRCKICKYEWSTKPSNVLYGYGCPICGIQKNRAVRMKTHNEYVIELFEKNSNIEAIEQYNGAHNPIKHYCKTHNVEFYVRPSDALKGCGCKKCYSEKLHNSNVKPHNQYEKELIDKNINVRVLETYVNAITPITHKCLSCEYEWPASPNNILRGSGCPVCNESHGEKLITSWLNNHKIKFIPQYRFSDCKDKHTLPFDFYLVDYNACIEFQGEQHYRPIDFFGGYVQFEAYQLHDQIKKDYCKNNNIPLLRIKYDENIEDKLNNFIH